MGNLLSFLQQTLLEFENSFQEFLANAQILKEHHERIAEELLGHTVNQHLDEQIHLHNTIHQEMGQHIDHTNHPPSFP